MESVGVGLLVGTGSYAEEAVLGVDCPESAVLADAEPCDIIAYAPNLVTEVLVYCRRNEHCEVGLTACGRECSGNVLNFAVRILNAEDEHVLSHPAFFSAEVGSDTQSEALLTEQNVSAVTGVDGPDGVVLREVADVTVLLVDICSCMQTLDEVSAVAESFQNVVANAGHDQHVENDVDGVGQLNAVLSKVGANDTHGVGNNVHGTTLHGTGVEFRELSIALAGLHPVVDVACLFLGRSADEGSVFYTCNVVDCSSVQIAVRKLFLVELNDLAGRASLCAQSFCLLLRAVDPNDLVRLRHSSHFVDPLSNMNVVCHGFFSYKFYVFFNFIC